MKIRRRLGYSEQPSEEARIEIVPLIDIMFFLLATFILSTLGLRQMNTLAPVTLPVSSTATDMPPALAVSVTPDGALTLEGQPLGRNELTARLKEQVRTHPATEVVVQADAQAPFAAVSRSLDAIAEAGVTEVRFAAEPGKTP